MEEKKKIITRFAPSPTGLLHLGTYRTAIFSYLFARKNNGSFILRIEDTDRSRSKKEYEENILESLDWLGLDFDQKYLQSENIESHKKHLEKMIKEGTAYISKEEAKGGSGEIKEVVRFKNPNIDVTFVDIIKGEVTMNTTDLGDFVIAKNMNEPLFHLAVVVDDFEEGITHVIRGEDHVSNTPRQILIQRAIGAYTPIYAHLPLVLGPDKLKLSKRRGAIPVTEYRALGYLPEAILNGVSFIGWNPGTPQEIFKKDELVNAFDLTKVQKSPAIFNAEKLDWFNREHLKNLLKEDIEKNILLNFPENLQTHPNASKIISLISERISKWSDVQKMFATHEFDFFFDTPTTDSQKVIFKNTTKEETLENLKQVIASLSALSEDHWNLEEIKKTMMNVAEKANTKGAVLHPIRYLLSGLEKSPDPFIIASILGKNETLSRLQKFI
ncbi:MAG: glutamate--tRNA ligase [Candidatus Pacebacteria bacterium]|nr:glutamate--tRNA ligase [Candidatus Paceibacterota bacterium]MCF7863150.1 glutamate--tRNA ligase [Candidatus Paceibacterota bacterium]